MVAYGGGVMKRDTARLLRAASLLMGALVYGFVLGRFNPPWLFVLGMPLGYSFSRWVK